MKLYANLYGYSSTKDFLKAQYGTGEGVEGNVLSEIGRASCRERVLELV